MLIKVQQKTNPNCTPFGPLDVLNNMYTLRIHLDDTGVDIGCLQIIPGCHFWGILPSGHIPVIRDQYKVFAGVAQKGDALLMRPHLLHASNKSLLPAHRRVLHLELSTWQLPEGITWG